MSMKAHLQRMRHVLSAESKAGFDIVVHADQFSRGGLDVAVELELGRSSEADRGRRKNSCEQDTNCLSGASVGLVNPPGGRLPMLHRLPSPRLESGSALWEICWQSHIRHIKLIGRNAGRNHLQICNSVEQPTGIL
jgi:hypothetical protein